MCCIPLNSLSSAESARLLDAHGIAPNARAGATDLSHGHPLALVLLAAEIRRLGHVPSDLGPDLVHALARRCVATAPTLQHRAALEACARARTTTVALLADVVDEARAPALFEWLAEQSYVTADRHGLVPHELVRDVIDEELRWSDPPKFRALQDVLNRHLSRRLLAGHHVAQTIFELHHLERHSPLMQQFFDYDLLGTITVSAPTAADAGAIERLRDTALPPGERSLFDYWRCRGETRASVARRSDGSVCGVSLVVRLDRVDDRGGAIDPVVAAVRQALGDRLREPVSLMSRFTIPEGERRGRNPALNALQVSHFTSWATEPGLRYWVGVVMHPDRFAPLLEGSYFQRLPGCEFVFDGVPLGCFARDWQAEPWVEWRDRMLDGPDPAT